MADWPGIADGTPEWMTVAVRHFEEDPAYMAHALTRYRQRHRLTERELAGELGCDATALLRLAARMRPNPAAPTFPAEVWDLAAAVGCDAFALSALLTDERNYDVRGYAESEA
jgi:hypothetical protein